LQPNTIVLPSDGSVTVSNVTATGLTLTGKVPSISPGSVLVDPAPPGLIRKVTAVSQGADGSAVLQTVQGTLEDVFQQVQMRLNKQLGPGDLTRASRLQLPNLRSVTRDVNLPLSFSGELAPGVTLAISGNLALGIDVGIDIGFSGFIPQPVITQAHAIATMDFTVQPTLTVQAGASFDVKKPYSAQPLEFEPLLLCLDPPIWVTPSLQFYAGASGQVLVGVDMTGSFGADVRTGLQYSADAGWQAVKSASPTGQVQVGTDHFTQLQLAATPFRAELSFKIESVAGPYIFADLPEFDLAVARKSSPPGTDVSADGVFDADLGFKVEVLGKELADYDLPNLELVRHSFYDKFYADDGQVTVGIQ
jgi:hypothetical protein